MDESTLIAGIAVGISIVTFIISLWRGQRAEARARKPVLVFVDDPDIGCWVLRNVGNGPALNVLVAQRRNGQWFNPVKLPPLARDATFPLGWLGRVNDTGLGATFFDFEGSAYTSTLGEEVVKTYAGQRLPIWPDSDVERHWQATPYDHTTPPRHPIPSDFSA